MKRFSPFTPAHGPSCLHLPVTIWRTCYPGSAKARRHPRAATAHNSIRDTHGMHPWRGMRAPGPFESEGRGLWVRLPHRLVGRTVSMQRAQSNLEDILNMRTLCYTVHIRRRILSTNEVTYPMSLQTNERTVLTSTSTSFASFCGHCSVILV